MKSRGFFLILLFYIFCSCSNLQFRQGLFSPENQLFLEGKFSFVEEKQRYTIQERGWGKLVERSSQLLAFPFTLFQSGNTLESQYEKRIFFNILEKEKKLPIQQLLQSEDNEVRSLALEMTEEVKILLEHLKDEDDFVRMQALERLRGYPSTEVVAEIERVVREDPEEFVRLEGIRSLSFLKFPESLNTLAFCLQDSQDHIRRGAALALAGYSAKQVVSLLLPLLNDPIHFVREAAYTSLQQVLQKESLILEDSFFNYDTEAPASQREEVILRLQEWWSHSKKTQILQTQE